MSDSDKEQSLDGDADAAGGVGTDPPPEQDAVDGDAAAEQAAVDADAAAEQVAVDGDVDAPEPPARAANNGEMPALQDDHTAQEEADAARRRILTQFICNAGDANLASAAARVIVEGGGDDGSAAAPAAAVTVEEGSEKVAVVAERGDERGADREEARAAQPPQKAQRSAAAPSASQSQRSAAQQQQQKPRNNIPNNSSTQKQEQQQTAVPAALQQAQLRAKATSAAGIPPEDSAYFMHHYANMQRLKAAASGRGGGNASSSSAAVMAAAAARRRYDAALMNSMYGGAVGGVGMSGGGNNGAKGNGIVRASSGGLGGGGSSNVTMSTEEQKQRAMLERFVASGGVGYSEQERAMIESFCGAGSRKNNGANDKSNVPNNNAAIAAAGQKGIQSRGRGAEKSKQQPDLPPNHPAVPRARPPSPASVAAAFRKRGAIGSAAIVSMARDRVAANSANNGGGGADTNTFASAAKARYETLYDEELQRLIKERARLAGVSKSPSAEGAAAIDDQHRMRMQMIQMERGRLAGQSPSAEGAAAIDDQHRMRMQMIQKERGRLGGQSPSAEGAAGMEDQLRMRMQMRHLNAVGSAAAQSEALRQYAGKDALMYERLMKAMQPKEGGGGGSGGKKKDNAEEDGGKSSKSAKSGFTPLSADGSKRRAEAGSTEDGSAKKAKFMTALPPGVTLLNERATSLGGEETTMSPMEELRTDPSFIDLIVSNSKQAVTGTIGGDSVSVREGAVKRKKQDALFGTFVRGLMNTSEEDMKIALDDNNDGVTKECIKNLIAPCLEIHPSMLSNDGYVHVSPEILSKLAKDIIFLRRKGMKSAVAVAFEEVKEKHETIMKERKRTSPLSATNTVTDATAARRIEELERALEAEKQKSVAMKKSFMGQQLEIEKEHVEFVSKQIKDHRKQLNDLRKEMKDMKSHHAQVLEEYVEACCETMRVVTGERRP